MNGIPIAPVDPFGFPASVGFVLFFKVLGFTLHLIPMNIWYAGLPLSAILAVFAKGENRTIAKRLAITMPIMVAVGVNLGIVPLLFTQVIYNETYYTAGILMGWYWFSVIFLLLFAYYGVYIYELQLRSEKPKTIGYVAGWVSAILFLVMGFLFANNFSLMVNTGSWLDIFHKTTVAGAVKGTGLNTGDAGMWARWLMMFGIAMTTTGAWIAVDGAWFGKKYGESYQKKAANFGFVVYTVGAIVAAIFAYWYIFGTIPKDVMQKAHGWVQIVMILTAASFVLTWLVFLIFKGSLNTGKAIVLALFQFLVLALNAVSRQWVQYKEIEKIVSLARTPVNWQWSSAIPFLILFVVGLAVLLWIITRPALAKAAPEA